MTRAARAQHGKNNILIGAGAFYLVELDDSDNPRGERYLGDSVGGSLTVTPETASVFAGDGEVAEALEEIVTQIDRRFSLTLHDITPANLALFVMGDIGSQTDSATAVTDEVRQISRQGLWYPLGVAAGKPAGIGAVAAKGFAVTWGSASDSATTEATVDEDYVLDAASGRLYIVPGGDIVADSYISVDYTPVAATIAQVTTGEAKQLRAGIRYIEESPPVGKGNDYYAPLCSIAPGGESQFKAQGRQSEQQLQLSARILEPASGPPLIINGRA
jgi:hypothetical protein